jgi:hypothetical protein
MSKRVIRNGAESGDYDRVIPYSGQASAERANWVEHAEHMNSVELASMARHPKREQGRREKGPSPKRREQLDLGSRGILQQPLDLGCRTVRTRDNGIDAGCCELGEVLSKRVCGPTCATLNGRNDEKNSGPGPDFRTFRSRSSLNFHGDGCLSVSNG